MITLGELVMIVDLCRQGLSLSARAQQLGVDRKTVSAHIAGGLAPPVYKKGATRVFSMVLGYSPVDLGALFSIRICKGSLAVTSARGDRLPRGPFFRTVKGELEWKPICLSSCR